MMELVVRLSLQFVLSLEPRREFKAAAGTQLALAAGFATYLVASNLTRGVHEGVTFGGAG
jgi:hypothetical protein